MWNKKARAKCVECGEMVKNVREHLKGAYRCRGCPYYTHCRSAWQRHTRVDCGKERGEVMRRSQKIIACAECGRSSCHDQSMLNHLLECGEGRAVVTNIVNDDDEFSIAQELKEAKMFGVIYEINSEEDDIGFWERLYDMTASSTAKANARLNRARLQSLKRMNMMSVFPLADMSRKVSQLDTA
ncbi:unnamed protein product [Gongylonema pulchrum]|uniref:MYND-type domain-containing protein n=1 Tax=Gongylonema pulchrum TaxID=637853 RepID=A0A183DRF3_9BILA|nr:unnamed protein product [Gongylonema pulchrum]